MAAVAVLPSRPMITPEEQLRLLALPMVQERLYGKGLLNTEVDTAIAFAAGFILKPIASEDTDFKDSGGLPELDAFDPLLDKVIESATRSILKTMTSKGSETQVPSLTDIVVERLVEPSPLPPILTNWYTALERIQALPDEIPALPRNIHQILGSNCPIHSNKRIGETHSLYLIPPGTLNGLEECVSAYGQTLYPNENPLKFRYFWDAARQEHANVQFNEHQWVLISNDVLPGSRNQSYEKQAQMVADLSANSFTNYQVPSLREASAAIFLHKVATGESLYQAGNEQNGVVYTYTRVKEITQNWHLIVGGSAPSGVRVLRHSSACVVEYIGVAALQKF